MEQSVEDPSVSHNIITSVQVQNMDHTKYKPERLYKFSLACNEPPVEDLLEALLAQDIDIQGLSVESYLIDPSQRRVHMQKRATCNTSQPGIEEVPGGSKENDDINLLFAALRELLEENGVLILNAKPLDSPYFYYWRHKNRTTGEYKWLIKFIFLFLVTNEKDVWFFRNRMWNSDKQRPEGNRLILIDPEEVSDTFSIKESQMKDMRVCDPQNTTAAKGSPPLVVRSATFTMLEHIFSELSSLDKPHDTTNRIAYFEESSDSRIPELKLDGVPVSINYLEGEGLTNLVKAVQQKRKAL